MAGDSKMAIIAALIANGGIAIAKLVAAKIELEPTLTPADVAVAVDTAETSLRAAVPAAGVVYLEPDIRQA